MKDIDSLYNKLKNMNSVRIERIKFIFQIPRTLNITDTLKNMQIKMQEDK